VQRPIVALAGLFAFLTIPAASWTAAALVVPSITSVTPGSGANGQEITISGLGFDKKPTVWLTAGSNTKKYPCKVLSFTTEEVVATLPQAPAGSFDLHVQVKSQVDDAAGAIQIVAPTVSGLSATSAAKNDLVTILGSNFGAKKGQVHITLSGDTKKKSAPVTEWIDDQVVFKMPSVAAGTYDVSVTNSAGTVSAGSLTNIVNNPISAGLHCQLNGNAFDAVGGLKFLAFHFLSPPPLIEVLGNLNGNPQRLLVLAFPYNNSSPPTLPATFTNQTLFASLVYQELSESLGDKEWSGSSGDGGSFTIQLTKKSGNAIEGTFSGTLKDPNGVLPDVVVTGGTFKGSLKIQP